MFLKDLNNFNSDLLDGKHASNTANNVPVLDSSAKLPIAQIPTGTTSSTVSLGNHTHSNVATANTLATARTINGTSFNGSANITTANWGTARNLQIGNTAKSVNGSANVSWSLSEIGAAASSHTHNYAGSSSAGGAANTATKLQTARTINGTSFDGSANITTANWGTARTITIGNTGKSVNGAGNVSWSLAEIGASRAHSASHSFGGNQNAITTAQFVTMLTNLGAFSQPHWISRGSWSYASNQYINDTKCGNIHLAGCVVEVFGNTSAYTIKVTTPTTSSSGVTNGDFIYVNNGSDYSPGWRRMYSTAYPQTTVSGNAGTATTLQTARTINGTSFNGSANITTANWGTARTLTIGNTGKSVNGSGNVSWSLSEIGAAPAGYGLGTTCQDKSNQDCNNILVTGFYMGSNMTNKPSGCTQGWIYLLVMRHNDSWVRQVAYDFGTASQVYTRVKQNGSWTSWVATDNNTWRGVQNNLTSTATDQSLSAAQGKILNDKITSLQNELNSNKSTLEANINSIKGVL